MILSHNKLLLFRKKGFSKVKLHLLLLLAFGLGVLSSLPIGAAQVEIAKRALLRRRKAAFAVLGGVLSANAAYGLAAFFGLSPLLHRPAVLFTFHFVGGILLLYFAWRTFQPPLSFSRMGRLFFQAVKKSPLKSKRLSYGTGLLLGATNPLQIMAWLFAAALAKSLKLVETFTPGASLLFLLFGLMGMGLYPVFLIFFLERAHRFLSQKALRRIYGAMGGLLVFLGALFLFKAAQMGLGFLRS